MGPPPLAALILLILAPAARAGGETTDVAAWMPNLTAPQNGTNATLVAVAAERDAAENGTSPNASAGAAVETEAIQVVSDEVPARSAAAVAANDPAEIIRNNKVFILCALGIPAVTLTLAALGFFAVRLRRKRRTQTRDVPRLIEIL
mmetsp:Transcript_7738/g.21713  ORF Transcript_7738/g.21713 Transcript_7738/m.21713 type:complete len:147 (+) Transcript_7738:72-512(+)